MCKFNNRLFNLILLMIAFVDVSSSLPHNRKTIYRNFMDYDYNYDYDLHYDQRQNGTENYRLNLNDFLVALPSEEIANNTEIMSAFESAFLNYVDSLEGFGELKKNKDHHEGENDDSSTLPKETKPTDSHSSGTSRKVSTLHKFKILPVSFIRLLRGNMG